MTFYFPTDATSYNFSVNVPNMSGTLFLVVQSLYNKNLYAWALTIEETNDRYTEFSMTLTDEETEGHFNGIFGYEIQDAEANVYLSGLLKWINEDGGQMGTEPYISDNENREAVQFYRP